MRNVERVPSNDRKNNQDGRESLMHYAQKNIVSTGHLIDIYKINSRKQ